MTILDTYKPKRYGKEFVRINGSPQYPMFVSMALGIKRSFDDWIPAIHFDAFKQLCKDYDVVLETGVIFNHIKDDKKDIIGGGNITTTFARAKRFDGTQKDGSVHVFVAKKARDAEYAKRFGWYSVVLGNRSVNKPFVDHLRFGKALGFPDCCIDFFKRFNNWALYSHPYETLKNTPKIEGKAVASNYCNNLLMDKTYFYIHNLPCSYRCEKTIKYAKEVEEKISGVEPDFVKKTKKILRMPALVFGEKNFIIFDGRKKDSKIAYTECEYVKNRARPEDSIDFYDYILNGDNIEIDDGYLNIMKNGKSIKKVAMQEQWFMIDFD